MNGDVCDNADTVAARQILDHRLRRRPPVSTGDAADRVGDHRSTILTTAGSTRFGDQLRLVPCLRLPLRPADFAADSPGARLHDRLDDHR